MTEAFTPPPLRPSTHFQRPSRFFSHVEHPTCVVSLWDPPAQIAEFIQEVLISIRLNWQNRLKQVSFSCRIVVLRWRRRDQQLIMA